MLAIFAKTIAFLFLSVRHSSYPQIIVIASIPYKGRSCFLDQRLILITLLLLRFHYSLFIVCSFNLISLQSPCCLPFSFYLFYRHSQQRSSHRSRSHRLIRFPFTLSWLAYCDHRNGKIHISANPSHPSSNVRWLQVSEGRALRDGPTGYFLIFYSVSL